jgi:preprotein translocase subunit YajC
MDSLGAILPLLLIGAVFYLLIMRPARNRQKQQAQLIDSLRPGAQVMTTAGIFGTIVEVLDDEVVIQVAPGVELRMVKNAIARVIEDEMVIQTEILPEAPEDIVPGKADETEGGSPRS